MPRLPAKPTAHAGPAASIQRNEEEDASGSEGHPRLSRDGGDVRVRWDDAQREARTHRGAVVSREALCSEAISGDSEEPHRYRKRCGCREERERGEQTEYDVWPSRRSSGEEQREQRDGT